MKPKMKIAPRRRGDAENSESHRAFERIYLSWEVGERVSGWGRRVKWPNLEMKVPDLTPNV
jgi:hypothetical protein